MTLQRNTASQEIGRYTYDAGGGRARRNTSGIVTWYLYGIDGELIAEYAATQPPSNPLTEYGYRNGEMLVTASSPAATQSATFAFTSTRDGQTEIYQLNADGTGLVRLTDNAATDDHADYSPDSQRLAFTSWRDGQEEIYVMNADGTGLVRVTNDVASDINAAWSPDGTRLVFASDRDGDHEIYTVNPDGTNLTQLTFNTSFDARPDWGSNNQIAFRSDRDGNAEIYTMNSDGSNQVNRTNNPAIDAAPVWSADGSQVAFVSQRDGNNEIYVMTADGTNPVNRTNHAASDASPDWSGDGVSILWMTTRDGQHEIYKMEVDGSNVVRLTNHAAQETMPVWRPVVGGGSSGGGVRWVVSDQLGTPRMTVDETGSLASVRRHDYAPYGEELFAGTGGRTAAQGYQPDNIRQQFTGYERDGETGLDYAQARYYASVQGRFISPDPLFASGRPAVPQSWNRYTYCLNNPLVYVDPDGLDWYTSYDDNGNKQPVWHDRNPGGLKRWKGDVYFASDIGRWVALNPWENQSSSHGSRDAAAGAIEGYSRQAMIDRAAGFAEAVSLAAWGGRLAAGVEVNENSYQYRTAARLGTMFAVAGAIGGGIAGASGLIDDAARLGDDGVTTLYRSVSHAEFAQIRRTGTFQAGPNSLGGKFFAESMDDAARWGNLLEGTRGFRIVDARLPTVQADRLMRWERLDGIGPARYAELDQLRSVVIRPVK